MEIRKKETKLPVFEDCWIMDSILQKKRINEQLTKINKKCSKVASKKVSI